MDNVLIRPRLLVEGEHGYVEGAGYRAHVPDSSTGRPLQLEGENKPLSQYWSARLRDGDVEEVIAAEQPADPPASTRPSKKPPAF